MSNNWTRGSRCGVDNCRTHYYKIIDGQRVCQYGHIFEGHVEYNDDDDENFIITKRLKIPRSQYLSQESQITKNGDKNKKHNYFYGSKGRELFFKCFQTVLKSQAKCLIDKIGLPDVLEDVIKSIWADYMILVLDDNLIDSLNNDDTDTGFTSGEHELTDDNDNNNNPVYNYTFKKLPIVIDSLSICYLACRHLRLPIYINDFIVWVTSNKIPYMRASFEIPKNLSRNLPTSFLKLFEPRRLPVKGDLCINVSRLATKLQSKKNTSNSYNFKLNYEPLLLRLTNELILPPRVYLGVKKLLELLQIDLDIPDSSQGSVISQFPEIKLISVLTVVVKLFFLMGSIPELNETKQLTPDWRNWRHILDGLHIDENGNERNFNIVLNNLLTSDALDVDIVNWDKTKTDKYLDWFQSTLISPEIKEKKDLSNSEKRLFNIFKLNNESDDVRSDEIKNDDDSVIESHTIETAYDKLLKSKSSNERLDDGQLKEIELVLIENLTINFGILPSQLSNRIRSVESSLRNFLKDV